MQFLVNQTLLERTLSFPSHDFFEWEDYEDFVYNYHIFNRIKTKQDFGIFPKGTRFDTATVSFDGGWIRFYDFDDEKGWTYFLEIRFKLTLESLSYPKE